MSVTALSTNNLASPSVSGVGAARPLYYKNLSNAGIAALTASQIGAMQSVEMAALSGSQIKAFNPAALAGGLPTYLNNKQVLTANFIGNLSNNQISQFGAPLVQALGTAFVKALTTAQIKGLDANHVQYLSAAQVASLSKAQLGALNGNQIKAIDNEDIRAMTTSQFSTLSMMQLQALTVGQIGQVDAFQIRTISAKNFASLYTDQVAAFTTKAVANLGGTQIAAMTKEQISQGLDPAKIGALSASRVRYFTPTQISALTNPEVAAISLDTMKTLYDPHLRAFTVDQLSHLSEDKIDWLIGKKLQTTGFTALQKDAILARKASFPNAAPTVAHPITDKSATEDVAFTFTVPSNTFADADSGDTLSYAATRADGSALPSWLSFNANSRTFAGTPGNADPGEINLKVTATDRAGASVSSAFKLTVANVNDAPTGYVRITGTATQGQTLTADHSLADADGLGAISYQWLLDGSNISGATNSNLTLTQAHVGRAISVRASYTDAQGTAESATSFTILSVANVNDAPTVANLITDRNATEGVAFSFTVPSNTFADADSGDTLSYAATRADGSALPTWLQFNANTRTFSGTPGYADPGELNLKVTASDLAGATVSSAFKLTAVASSAVLTKQWTKLLGTSVAADATALTTGADGSIYVSGGVVGSLDDQNTSGGWDAFITKFSTDGDKQWTRLLGSSPWYNAGSADEAHALTTGADGSIYVAGVTKGDLLDGQNSSGGMDAFIAKFSPAGDKQWTKLLGTSSWDEANALTAGADGSIYVSGYTGGNLLGQSNSNNQYDAFITKFDPDGDIKWTSLLYEGYEAKANAVTSGADGSTYVSGLALTGRANSGTADAFIAKFNPSGQKQWTRLLGTSSRDEASAMTTGRDGSIYVSGWTWGNLDGQTNSGDRDAFLTKFNPNGEKQWTKLLGTANIDYASALTTGVDGSIYVSGTTNGSLDGQATDGSWNAFVTKFNPDGTLRWTQLLGSNSADEAHALTTGADGSVYIAGWTTGTLDGQANNSGGYGDAFVTKYSL